MLKPNLIVGVFLVGLLVIDRNGVLGQEYPNKSIRIVTAPAGGGSDLISRLIAQGISGPLGQPVIVDNRAGVIPGEIVSRAPPDGYTLLAAGGSFWIEPFLQKSPYAPVKDFAPVTLATWSPNILAVHPSLPVKSVKELIALARAKPGDLHFGSGGPGSNPHLSAELFKAMAGVDIVHVPYKGLGPALNGMIGNEVQLTFGSATSVLPHIRSGRLLALAITSPKRSAIAPSLPTMAEFLPGFEAGLLLGIFAPSRTPDPIIRRVNQEIVRALQTSEVKEKVLSLGADPVGSSPAGLAAAIKSDMARWGRVIKDAGIRAE